MTLHGKHETSVRTVRDWGQGRREPGGPAKALLCIAEQYSAIVAQLA